jgi:hypothetical protein
VSVNNIGVLRSPKFTNDVTCGRRWPMPNGAERRLHSVPITPDHSDVHAVLG